MSGSANIRGGRVIDPASGRDEVCDIFIADGAFAAAPAPDAVEIDANVHGAIRANAARNGIADRVRVAAALPAVGAGNDVVVANIVADVLVDHAAGLCARVRRGSDGRLGGGFVLSGLRGDEVDRVADRYRGLLGTAPRLTTLGEWHCLRFG